MKLNKTLLNNIYNDIKDNPFITEIELSKKYYYHERTIRRYIKYLKNLNLIKLKNCGIRKKWIIIDNKKKTVIL